MTFESCIEASEHLEHSGLQCQLTIQCLTRPAPDLTGTVLHKKFITIEFLFYGDALKFIPDCKMRTTFLMMIHLNKMQNMFSLLCHYDPNTCRLLIVAPPCEGVWEHYYRWNPHIVSPDSSISVFQYFSFSYFRRRCMVEFLTLWHSLSASCLWSKGGVLAFPTLGFDRPSLWATPADWKHLFTRCCFVSWINQSTG